MMTEIRQIAVLGAGTMGHGIAHAAIAAGYATRLYDVSGPALAKGREAVEGIVKKGVELGKVDAGEAGAMLGRLTATTDLGQALGGST
jgi:3-hydroxyacyl-CoA dehydrogenase